MAREDFIDVSSRESITSYRFNIILPSTSSTNGFPSDITTKILHWLKRNNGENVEKTDKHEPLNNNLRR
jgi:hypothetical protein